MIKIIERARQRREEEENRYRRGGGGSEGDGVGGYESLIAPGGA